RACCRIPHVFLEVPQGNDRAEQRQGKHVTSGLLRNPLVFAAPSSLAALATTIPSPAANCYSERRHADPKRAADRVRSWPLVRGWTDSIPSSFASDLDGGNPSNQHNGLPVHGPNSQGMSRRPLRSDGDQFKTVPPAAPASPVFVPPTLGVPCGQAP